MNLTCALTFLLGAAISISAAQTGKTFATAQDAASALIAATATRDSAALHALFGPAGSDLENPDRVQSTNELNAFTAAFNRTNRLASLSPTQYVLEVGEDLWPFPIPIVQKDGRWFFDTQLGKDELLSRRIGQNELAALEVMRAYVDAQREYASKDRDGDGVLEYAQRIASSPGKTDGLFWTAESSNEISPLGPLLADAQSEGYFTAARAPDAAPQPFHGYFFRILNRQGTHAPGGRHEYVINGNMIVGHALIAWPAEYGTSGVMTFVVNQQGRVYQRDLGAKTAALVKKIGAYDPDRFWQISPD